uniref:Uncharacterized protein n=1 Tax=Cucumis melo TaxID=3656 RepID=A0A9I9DJA7_CUCME
MAKNKNVDQSEKKKALSTGNPSERDIEVVCSDNPVSKQAQLSSSLHNEALPSSSEVFGTEGWNPFNFKGKEISMTDENNIGMMLKLLLEESNKRKKVREEVEKKKKEDDKKARKARI